MQKPLIAILVRHNYWQATQGPGNASTHRTIPDIMRALRKAGGEPVLVYQGQKADQSPWDGVVLPGGQDLHPRWYGQSAHPSVDLTSVDEDFDRFQLNWAQQAIQQGKPLLGICRGMQVLNVAQGGSLIQDVPLHAHPHLAHDPLGRSQPVHGMTIAEDSGLYSIVKSSYLRVNSIHHQAVDRLGRGLRAVAWAPDGVIEAVESSQNPRQRGVQFHPEDMLNLPGFQMLFDRLVEDSRVGV